MTRALLPFIAAALIFGSSCRIGYTSGKEMLEADWFDPINTLTVWVLADIQPTKKSHRKAWEKAVRDVNENVPGIDFAIVAGDIVNDTQEETFDWYVNTRNGSYVEEWYEIIGNHDLKTDMGKLFREKLREDTDYAILKGNVLFIFMSDSERGKSTVISDETFEWWKDLVVNNQDKIKVVVTHAPLKGSGISFSAWKGRNVVGSKRFRQVLKDYRVDLWFSGHLHTPHGILSTTAEKESLGGTIFIHVSSIRPEMAGMKESESRVMTFVCGSDKVLVRVRNHERHRYVTNLDEVFTLSKPYECKDVNPVAGPLTPGKTARVINPEAAP